MRISVIVLEQNTRREIASMAIAKKNRRNLLALSRKREAEATAKARLALQLEREAISCKGKKQLQAFIRMEKVAANWKAQSNNLGDIAQRIDGKGVVIFTLASCGSVRDAGKEVFYSCHDDKAREIALLYAGLKWGRNVALEKGRIMFHQTPKPEQ
jgi:hypothetical protein